MRHETETIARYRSHAGTLRTISKDAKDAQMRLSLVTLADDFERLAEGMETGDRRKSHAARSEKPE
jgi:hypothetical protein